MSYFNDEANDVGTENLLKTRITINDDNTINVQAYVNVELYINIIRTSRHIGLSTWSAKILQEHNETSPSFHESQLSNASTILTMVAG